MLTDEKRQEIRDLLAQVNITTICEEKSMSRSAIYRALNGNRISEENLRKLKEVVSFARKELKNREREIHSI